MDNFNFSFTVNSDISASDQGQFASAYTSQLKTFLETDHGASYVAYLAHTVNNLDIPDALDLVALIQAGTYTLDGLFNSAQSKGTTIITNVDDNPEPTMTINGVTIDLTAILKDAATFNWSTTTKKETINHAREYYETGGQPAGWTEEWANSQPPVNEAPSAASFTETLNEFNIKAGAPVGGNNLFTINLLQNAVDPDPSDTLSVVVDTVEVKLGTAVVSNSAFTVSGNNLIIDTNDSYFDLLFKEQKWTFDVSYNITDGVHTVPSAGTVEVTGTADQFSVTGTVTGSVTPLAPSFDGNFNVLIPTASLVTGAPAYSDFAGTATVTAVGDLGGYSEFVMVTVEGSTALKLGGDGSTAYASTSGNNDGSSSVSDTETGTFSSSDATVAVSYDSQTANTYTQGATTTSHQHVGVDAMASITVELSNITYWA